MGKIIVTLGINKWEDNNNGTCQLNHPQNLLLISIVDTPKKDISTIDRKSEKRKIRTSSVESSPALFYSSIWAMYNIFYRAQNKHLMLKSFILKIGICILTKKNDENIFSEKLVNELHSWIENHPHVIHLPNVKRLIFCEKLMVVFKESETSTSNISTRATQ